MVTVCCADGADLRLTHHCAAGNQPAMQFAGVDGNTLRFEFVPGTNMKPTDRHMHPVKITTVDSNHAATEWTSWRDGKAADVMLFERARKSYGPARARRADRVLSSAILPRRRSPR